VDNFLNDESQMQVLEEDEEIDHTQRVRNKEIKNLVNTINDLAVLFKDLSVLVVE
jgi:t-SNARE complex subunit (syntaxin)